ncbi:MAG: VWA domain-containing protein [Verrucomicrobiia bacterium]|jgi:Flp pilus assembly protein TadG
MKKSMIQWNARCRSERGQMLPLIALAGAALIALIGLSIDLGFAYVTKARLSKACDAGALAGMNNINLNLVNAGNVASATFAANYAIGKSSLTDTPTVSYYFGTDSGGNPTFSMAAVTHMNTFFVRVLGAIPGMPNWTTLTIGETAQVVRATLYLTMVQDRSGSLQPNPPNPVGNGGAVYMLDAVTNFTAFFDDTRDNMGLVTFATIARIDAPIAHPFVTTIRTNVSKLADNNYAGYTVGTFSQGGLTNALVMENNISVPTGRFVKKAVVFFTDGHANIIQQVLNCSPPTSMSATNVLVGGRDDCASDEGFDICASGTTYQRFGERHCPNNVNSGNYCQNSTNFPSSKYGGALKTLNYDNICEEAEYQAVQVANAMRQNGIIVYSIGLGSDINEDFLRQIANDPHSTTYDPSLPVGAYVPAPDASQLQAAFQRVAEELLIQVVR